MYNPTIKFKYLLVSVVILLLLCVNKEPSVYLIGFCNLASLIILGNGIRKIQGKFLSPFLLVGACLYLFHSGHLWLALLDMSPKEVLTSFEYDYRTTNYPYILNVYRQITILLVIYMSIGVLVIKPCINKYNILTEKYLATKLFKNCFIILYVVAMFFELQRAVAVATTSYGEGYTYGSNIALYIASITDVLLIFFLYIYRYDKKQFNFYLFLQLFRTLFIMFLVGNRGSSVIYLLVTLFIVATYSYLAKDTKKLRKIIIGVVVFFSIALPFISATRGKDNPNIGLNEFVKTKSPIESFMEEFGSTAGNTFMAIDYVNFLGPSCGLQILGTSLTLFPGSTAMFGDIIISNVSIASKLNVFHNRKYLGGSLIGQLYYNFYNTYFLYLSMVLIALLVSWNSNSLMRRDNSLYATLFFLCLFSGLMTFVRGEWYDVVTQVKSCLYVILLLYVSRKLLIKRS